MNAAVTNDSAKEQPNRKHDSSHRRKRVYFSVAVALTISYIALRNSGWNGSAQLHTFMEGVATVLALFVGAMALVRYYTKRDQLFLVIGTGFFGTALLDGYHTLVTADFFQPFMPSDLPSLIPWSWIASRLYLSVFMLVSYYVLSREIHFDRHVFTSEKVVYGFAGIFTTVSFLFFAFVPLPAAYFPDNVFHRPEEFLPAVIFLLALIGHLRLGRWRTSHFDHWLVLSLLVGVLGQTVFMSFSGMLFDFEFDAAHLLKKVSYICVLFGPTT